MSVLDELRKAMSGIGYDEDEQRRCLRALDTFEAAHPGLVDETPHCDFCGKPLPTDEDGCVDWNNTPVLAHDDGSPMYGCPDCAKEATE